MPDTALSGNGPGEPEPEPEPSPHSLQGNARASPHSTSTSSSEGDVIGCPLIIGGPLTPPDRPRETPGAALGSSPGHESKAPGAVPGERGASPPAGAASPPVICSSTAAEARPLIGDVQVRVLPGAWGRGDPRPCVTAPPPRPTDDSSSDTVGMDGDSNDLDSAYSTDVSEARLRRRRS